MALGDAPGVFRASRREAYQLVSSRYALVLLVLLPLAGFGLVSAIFWNRLPSDLPVAVVDADRSLLSRRLVRMVDATKSMRVTGPFASPSEALDEVLAARAYAVVAIPAHLERDVKRGAAPKVVLYYDALRLIPGSIVKRDVRAVVGTLSAGVEIQARKALGETPDVAAARFEPVRSMRGALFNPGLDYLAFLVPALGPTLLSIFVLVGAVHALGAELRDGTAGAWLAAGGSATRAVVGTLLPQTLHFTALGLVATALQFRLLGIPLRGSPLLVAFATLLLVLAYQAVGLLIVALSANLRLASSAAAFYGGPAFAFTGVTFPTFGMPLAAKAWGALLPLTHYLDLLLGQAMRGAPPSTSLAPLAALAAFVFLVPPLALWRMGRVMRDPSYWGRT
ncbi:MAG: ABC transporter permease [Holophagales bacterium]|nr:ABC transporter permease [Holophagales bacterium]